LLRPRWRREIVRQSEEAPPRSTFWYFVNRFLSGVGSFLVFLAISRSNPAMVSAVEGIRYVIIFIGAYAITRWKPEWLKEDFGRNVLIGKSVATALIVAGLVLAGLAGRSGADGADARRPTFPERNGSVPHGGPRLCLQAHGSRGHSGAKLSP